MTVKIANLCALIEEWSIDWPSLFQSQWRSFFSFMIILLISFTVHLLPLHHPFDYSFFSFHSLSPLWIFCSQSWSLTHSFLVYITPSHSPFLSLFFHFNYWFRDSFDWCILSFMHWPFVHFIWSLFVNRVCLFCTNKCLLFCTNKFSQHYSCFRLPALLWISFLHPCSLLLHCLPSYLVLPIFLTIFLK